MNGYSTLLVAHILFTTAGYVGLIATNSVVLILCARREPGLIADAISAWRRSVRIFGPILGIGLLLGFWLAQVLHVGLASLWLLVTYALVVAALATQAAIMIPWQFRAHAAATEGAALSARPIVTVVSVFTIVYIAIVSLMTLRPGS
jgi:hypothetical protein